MNLFLKINPEELGRFLLAYHRKVFGPFNLGAAFLIYYGLSGYKDLLRETSDEKALEFIKEEFLGGFD